MLKWVKVDPWDAEMNSRWQENNQQSLKKKKKSTKKQKIRIKVCYSQIRKNKTGMDRFQD
jgi:hypothetical protein